MPETPPTLQRSAILMDTHVSITVVDERPEERHDLVERALGWFERVEEICSRFDPASEVMRLAGRVGQATEVSPLLFETVRFALEVARISDGAFDPTVGYALERRGFNRHYRSGQIVRSALPPDEVSWRDVEIDAGRREITLRRPLILDLGAVAKGLAIDLAARELAPCPGFAVDAGGDVYVHGTNPDGRPWRVGIRHPRHPGQLLGTVEVSDLAVCTSGDYERPSDDGAGHHILDPRSRQSADRVASVTTIGLTAMAADAIGTAAFVLGPAEGTRLIEGLGLSGLIVTPGLVEHYTRRFKRSHQWQPLP